MPSRSGSTPSPLEGLPRPLSDRDRRGPVGRRALTMGLVAGIIGAVAFTAVSSWEGGPFSPAGAAAGVADDRLPGDVGLAAAGRSTDPSGSPAPARSPSPAPTATPLPTPTPVPTPAPVEALTGYRWPLPRGRVTLPFGPTSWGSRIVDGEKFHDGLDLATFCGDRIVAAHAGTVLAAGRHYDDAMGWIGDLQPYQDRLDKKNLYPTLPIVVVIDDGNGYRSIYAHFSKVAVKKGETVKAGQYLGVEGETGRASGCHLHYGVFSPLETATFAIDPKITKRMKLPAYQIARVDPLLVLPDRPKPTKAPTPSPTVTPPP